MKRLKYFLLLLAVMMFVIVFNNIAFNLPVMTILYLGTFSEELFGKRNGGRNG